MFDVGAESLQPPLFSRRRFVTGAASLGFFGALFPKSIVPQIQKISRLPGSNFYKPQFDYDGDYVARYEKLLTGKFPKTMSTQLGREITVVLNDDVKKQALELAKLPLNTDFHSLRQYLDVETYLSYAVGVSAFIDYPLGIEYDYFSPPLTGMTDEDTISIMDSTTTSFGAGVALDSAGNRIVLLESL